NSLLHFVIRLCNVRWFTRYPRSGNAPHFRLEGRMKRIYGSGPTIATLVVCLVALLVTCRVASAQTASVSGVVLDKDGGAVPGATVIVKQEATGITTTLVTNASGVFSAPALASGIYTVTVSLDGFKTSVVSN